MTVYQMVMQRRGRLGRLGRQIATYAYARARVTGLVGFSEKTKNLILTANILPSLPSLPNGKEKQGKAKGYDGRLAAFLPPIRDRLPPYPPKPIQYLAEQ